MEISGRVKPEIELLLSVSFSLSEDIGVHNIRVPTSISQELKIYLIMSRSLRRQLHVCQKKPSIMLNILINCTNYFIDIIAKLIRSKKLQAIR